jgi:MFS family permease
MCFGLFMVMLDNTVVNLALPTIQRELTSGLTGLQWIVDAFTLLLASLMLTGGTLGSGSSWPAWASSQPAPSSVRSPQPSAC